MPNRSLRAKILTREELVIPLWLRRHVRRRYVQQIVVATPPWCRRSDFAGLRAERDRLTRETGVPHVLDHVVPLNHPRVCGLNVPWNLEVTTRRRNAAKSNRWEPDQLDMFEAK